MSSIKQMHHSGPAVSAHVHMEAHVAPTTLMLPNFFLEKYRRQFCMHIFKQAKEEEEETKGGTIPFYILNNGKKKYRMRSRQV